MINVYVSHGNNTQVDYVGDCLDSEVLLFADMFKGTDESPTDKIVYIDDTVYMPHDAFDDIIISEHIKLESMFPDYPELLLFLNPQTMSAVRAVGTYPFEPEFVTDWPSVV